RSRRRRDHHGGRVKRILVVEDEDSFRTLIERILKRAGFDLETAVDGEQAAERLAQQTFDLVVSDWNMPKMDGGQLVRWMRKSSAHRRLPVLMLTVRSRPQDEVEGFACGADDYLAKPYSSKELLARIDRLLGIGLLALALGLGALWPGSAEAA